MNYVKELILIKGEYVDNVQQYGILGDKVKVTYSNGNSYPYNRSNVVIVENYKKLNHSRYIFTTAQGKVLNNISELYKFEYLGNSFLRFVFVNQTYRTYPEKELQIKEDILNDKHVQSLIEYFKKCAAVNNLRDSSGIAI